jgi:hypothetical protein
MTIGIHAIFGAKLFRLEVLWRQMPIIHPLGTQWQRVSEAHFSNPHQTSGRYIGTLYFVVSINPNGGKEATCSPRYIGRDTGKLHGSATSLGNVYKLQTTAAIAIATAVATLFLLKNAIRRMIDKK